MKHTQITKQQQQRKLNNPKTKQTKRKKKKPPNKQTNKQNQTPTNTNKQDIVLQKLNTQTLVKGPKLETLELNQEKIFFVCSL